MRIREIKISELNEYINKTIKNDFLLKNVLVEGEVSNINIHHTKNIYFTIKDEQGRLQCIFFKKDDDSNIIKFENIIVGDWIQCLGNVSFFKQSGTINFLVSDIKRKDVSDEKHKLDELKAKLNEKGYFDLSNKKDIERNPKKIGIITSPTGAVIHDIYNVIKRRYPIVDLILYPAFVQGIEAEESIINGIKNLDEYGVDTIIIARGGGSSEDMQVFNLETVADAIFEAKTPIISAVGHEVDFTIADFVADVRASTPSVAAEISVPDILNIIRDLETKKIYATNILKNKFKELYNDVQNKIKNFLSIDFETKINAQILYCERSRNILQLSVEKTIKDYEIKLKMYEDMLKTLNPHNLFDKGWSIAYKENIIKSANDLKKNDILKINFKDGFAKVEVKEVNKYEN